jgi:hypothetical protein
MGIILTQSKNHQIEEVFIGRTALQTIAYESLPNRSRV